jgi:hypothetical protein
MHTYKVICVGFAMVAVTTLLLHRSAVANDAAANAVESAQLPQLTPTLMKYLKKRQLVAL